MKKCTGTLVVFLLVALFFLWSAAPAAAETATLYPTADAPVFIQNPDSHYNNWPSLDLICAPDGQRGFSFILFDLSGIPAGSRIDYAVLHLFVQHKVGLNYEVPVFRCTEPLPTYIMWNNQPSVSSSPVTETVFSAPENADQSIDLTGLVQGWINGDYPNYGIKIGLPFLIKNTAWFVWSTPSKEGPSNWPLLVINYALPAASGSETGSTGSEATPSSTTGTSIGSTEPTPLSSAPATGSQITKVKAEKIKTSSAYITWVTDVDSNSYVEYGDTTKYGKTSGKDDRVKTHAVQLIELKPNKTYHFRVKSTNADGHQVVSKDYTFRTAEEPKAEETGKNEEKSNVWLWVAIGGLGLLVLVLGGILIFLYIRNRRRKNPQQKSET